MTQELQYVTALRGLRRTHIRYPGASNEISVCRLSTHVKPATRAEFDKNPCAICARLEPEILACADKLRLNGSLDEVPERHGDSYGDR